MLVILLIAALLPVSILANLPIIPCPGYEDVPPRALRVPNCDSFPCHVGHVAPNHGHDFDYEAEFMAHFSSQTLTLSVFQTAFGETIPVHLPEEQVNACNGLVGASCPVNAHQMLTHGGNIEGEGDLHGGIPVRMTIQIADDDHVCMCAIIDVIVH